MRDVMPALVRDLPAGMNAKISYDKSIFIEESISAVYTTIAEAVVLVVIVIFFFLRTLRATIIPLTPIPVSLLSAFAVMILPGSSLNHHPLLSMLLPNVLVVDDAIVVLDYILPPIYTSIKPT